jgi:hypothetical protein
VSAGSMFAVIQHVATLPRQHVCVQRLNLSSSTEQAGRCRTALALTLALGCAACRYTYGGGSW